jgi:hypothetical protein
MAPLPWHELEQRYNQLVQYHNPATAYADWEAFRSWFNATFTLLECFLEDAWNEQVEARLTLNITCVALKPSKSWGL